MPGFLVLPAFSSFTSQAWFLLQAVRRAVPLTQRARAAERQLGVCEDGQTEVAQAHGARARDEQVLRLREIERQCEGDEVSSKRSLQADG
jgi:hypothetical protein